MVRILSLPSINYRDRNKTTCSIVVTANKPTSVECCRQALELDPFGLKSIESLWLFFDLSIEFNLHDSIYRIAQTLENADYRDPLQNIP